MNWKSLVGSIAPILGGTLGGPFGAMAGNWLANELGVEPGELEKTVSSANSETLLKIKELDNKFKIDMEAIGLSKEKLHAEDRNSARVMASNTTLTPQIVLACIFVIGFIAVLYSVFTGEIEIADKMRDMANYLLGILSAGLVQIMNFFFGSSSGSKEKTQKMKI